ncbi:MAG: hypothetical protein HN948_05345 [Clostridia bacterium]|nr:hypothetical protein [Clostridia bacterium]MBT7122418.1 hypothetical protein [Clostridia bacterium]
MKSQSIKYRSIKRSFVVVLSIALLFAFAPVASAAPDDNVNFADANLKQAFLDAGADTGDDGQITQGELAALTGSVDCSSRNIEDLDGIAYATGITGIDLSGNNISDIGTLTALTGLTDANVSNNYLDITNDSSDMADINALIADGCTTIYSPQKDIPVDSISSSLYDINDGVLRYVTANTSAAQLLGNIDNDVDNLAVISGSSVFTGSAVGTGMKVRLSVDGTVRDEVTVVALGDVNGDGIISITDYTLTRLDILELSDLIGLFTSAADIDGNGHVSISDYTLLRLHILSIKPITGDGSPPPEVDGPSPQELIDFALTQLGKPYVRGGKGPDSFDCSGFVYYCLNSIGYEIGYMTSTVWRSANYLTINSMDNIEMGDILCFDGHVGIYMGDGRMVDASSGNGMIVTRSNIFSSSYWTSNFICAKRVL